MQRLQKLEAGLGGGRKVMRLMKTLDFIVAGSKALDEANPVLRLLLLLDAILIGTRMLYDNMQWAAKIGVYMGDEKALGTTAMKFWFWGLILAIARRNIELSYLQEENLVHKRSGDNSKRAACRIKRYSVIMAASTIG